MDPLRNLPVYLRYEEDGTVFARCPLVPDCQCRSATRAMALRTMQQLLLQAAKASPLRRLEKYEVVFLAVAPTSDLTRRKPILRARARGAAEAR